MANKNCYIQTYRYLPKIVIYRISFRVVFRFIFGFESQLITLSVDRIDPILKCGRGFFFYAYALSDASFEIYTDKTFRLSFSRNSLELKLYPIKRLQKNRIVPGPAADRGAPKNIPVGGPVRKRVLGRKPAPIVQRATERLRKIGNVLDACAISREQSKK